eukprot:m.959446 g.959446  ORF g.959446 m.959446 type:complete len:1169 (-) comp23882_c0_seq47:1609-5115(-)
MGCCTSQVAKDARQETHGVQVNPAFSASMIDKNVDENSALSVHHLCTVLRPQCLKELENTASTDESITPNSIAHMVSGYIKPLTRTKKTSYLKHVVANFQNIVADAEDPADHYGRATAMLSYTWGYQFLDVIQSIQSWASSSGLDPKRTYVWICSLCVNQHNLPSNPAATFEQRIVSIGTLLPLLSPWNDPVYVKRLWCLYELWLASRNTDCTVEVLFPENEVYQIREELHRGTTSAVASRDKFKHVLDGIHCADAEATMAQDRKFIRAQIEKTTGFKILDEVVQNRLRALYMNIEVTPGTHDSSAVDIAAACQMYVAVGCADMQFAHRLHDAYRACEDTFIADKKLGHPEPVNIKAYIGIASAARVKQATAAAEVLPCLVWLATGPDVLTSPHPPPTKDHASPCAFISDLCDANARVDVAVVGMTYGAAWAAQQLVDLGIARVAVYVQADTVLVGQHLLYKACVGVVQGLLRQAIFQSVPANVAKSLTTIWDTDHRRFLSDTECAFGVIEAPHEAPALLQGLAHGTHQAFTPQVPVGNYFQNVFGAAPHNDNAAFQHLDVAHHTPAMTLMERVAGKTAAANDVSVVFVVPDWVRVPESSTAHEEVGPRTQGVIEFVCGHAAVVNSIDFVVTIAFDETRKLHDQIADVPQNRRGIIWLQPTGTFVAEYERLWEGLCELQQANQSRRCMSGWVFVTAVRPDAWAAALADDVFEPREGVCIVQPPARERMHLQQCALLRLTGAAALDAGTVRDALYAAVAHGRRTDDIAAQTQWIGAIFPDGPDLVVSIVVSSLRLFQRLRSAVLLGTITPQLQATLGPDIAVDKSAFAAQYAAMLMEFDSLTPHQQSAMEAWSDAARAVVVDGPAGSGKTFVALHRLLTCLQYDVAGGHRGNGTTVHVAFVSQNEALGLFFGRWIFRIIAKDKGYRATMRIFNKRNGIWVLSSAAGSQKPRLRRLLATADEQLSYADDTVDASIAPSELRFLVVDEAHHIYEPVAKQSAEKKHLRSAVNDLIKHSATVVFCTDMSQADRPDSIRFPIAVTRVQLRQVVRNSRRVVEASMAFLGAERGNIEAYSDQAGPPLIPYIFKPCTCETSRQQTYTAFVWQAMEELQVRLLTHYSISIDGFALSCSWHFGLLLSARRAAVCRTLDREQSVLLPFPVLMSPGAALLK